MFIFLLFTILIYCWSERAKEASSNSNFFITQLNVTTIYIYVILNLLLLGIYP